VDLRTAVYSDLRPKTSLKAFHTCPPCAR